MKKKVTHMEMLTHKLQPEMLQQELLPLASSTFAFLEIENGVGF